MLNEALNLSQKRLAIERALGQFLPQSVLERVLNYWEQEYGEKPTFVLNRFVNDICHSESLQSQRKEMLRHVLQELATLEKQVLMAESQQTKTVIESQLLDATEEVESEKNIADACFYFVGQVMQHVGQSDRLDFQHEVQYALQKQKIALGNLLDVHSYTCMEGISTPQYAALITVLYMQYCDFYGPVKTDQLYASIRKALKLNFPDVDLSILF